MSFDYPSGQGSKSAAWDYPNLHDSTQMLAVGWVYGHTEVVSGHFEAAQGWCTSYLLWTLLLLYLLW